MAWIKLPPGVSEASFEGIILRGVEGIAEISDDLIDKALSLLPGSTRSGPPVDPNADPGSEPEVLAEGEGIHHQGRNPDEPEGDEAGHSSTTQERNPDGTFA